jgi:hypothetical protein
VGKNFVGTRARTAIIKGSSKAIHSVCPHCHPFTMFPVHSFTFVFLLFTRIYAQVTPNVTVNSEDPRLVYTGQWIDQDNGGHEFTRDPNATVSLTFLGLFRFLHPMLAYPYMTRRHCYILALSVKSRRRYLKRDPRRRVGSGHRCLSRIYKYKPSGRPGGIIRKGRSER